MDCVISVAAKVAEYTVAPIRRQLGYLVSYNANFKGLTDHVKELEGARDEIKHRVEEERRNGKTIETSVQNWLDSVDGVIEKEDELQKDPRRAKAGCSRWSFPNLVSRHQLSRKATKMTRDIVEIQGKKNFEQVAYLPALDEVVPILPARGNVDFSSRKPIKENIVQALRDPKLSFVGLYGLGGVGKSTLVEEVARIAKQEKLFDAVVMVTVSKTPDIKTIQGKIADDLGLRFEEETIAGRALRLCQRIKNEETILIILDDIWERLDLKKVGIPFKGEHNGCKLLMTSRNLDVLRQMEVRDHFKLEVLDNEETESFFKVMAGDLDDGLIEIASQVAKKCGGLPVLIVTVAKSLMNQDIYVWKDSLKQLDRADNEEIQQITYSALEFTYNRLEEDQMKKFFLLCATAAEEPFISDLFKYGVGLGIFSNSNTLEEARNRLYTIISALKASCLLLVGNSSTRVRMHDVVREVAISIASRDEHVFFKRDELNEWPTIDFLRKCSQIKLFNCQIYKLPEKLDCPNLEFFYLRPKDPYSQKLSDSFFEGMENIKVVDLTRMNIPSLPTSFHFLTSLQTLCLDQCILENMDAIGTLKNLQILSLIHSSLKKLPSEIGNLTQLRMLDLSNSGIEVIPPHIISSLINLEELYMGNTSIKWEIDNSATQNMNASLDELMKLPNLTALELQVREAWMLPRDLMFDKLERYKIVIGDVWEWSDIKEGILKTLMLKLGTNIHLEHGIKQLIKGAENLYLDEVEGISNVLYQLNGEGFPQLKHLYIQNNAKIKHIIESMDRSHAQVFFPKLETLTIHNLNVLENICLGPVPNNSFAKLRAIKVKNCIPLKFLLLSSMVEGLPKLSEIEVGQCDLMEKIVSADSNATQDKIEFLSLHSLTLHCLQTLDSFFSFALTLETEIPAPFFNARVGFPNLDTLKLSSLNLNKIWEESTQSFEKLKNLVVENCGELKYLFSSFTVESFPNLTRLEICDCPIMEEIIAPDEPNNIIAESREVQFSKLETIILKNMKNLKKIWHNQFGRLKMLEVKNCEKVIVIFPSSMQKTYLNLETLVVTDCPLVEEIFAFTFDETCNAEEISQLKRITLKQLPKLKETWRCDPQGMLSFNNIEDVSIGSCGNLLYVLPLSIASSCSHLKQLYIRFCENLKEIVAQKKGSICTVTKFEFNQLNTLWLISLPRLKRFYAENHTLSCPSLEKLCLLNCPTLNLLRTLSTSRNEGFLDGKLNISMQLPPLMVDEVIPNVKSLTIDQMHAEKILQAQNIVDLFPEVSYLQLSLYENEDFTFPDWVLQNLYNLKFLRISVSSFKKIFQDEMPSHRKNNIKLEKLNLYCLPQLEHICEEGFQIHPALEFIEYLRLEECLSMKNLVPSSVKFSHLTYLKVIKCNGMINIILSPTAISLVNLSVMMIQGCNSLQEIIAEKEDDTIYDISFRSLEFLTLECLPKLERFCSSKYTLSFPSLRKVVVKQCPRMKYFSEGDISTPKLRKVITKENNKEWHWKGDLNSTIQSMFDNKVAFSTFEKLTLSQFPELKDIWYGQLHHKMFGNLKSMLVHRCDFLLDSLFSSNTLQVLYGLEVLEVRDCDSLETVFDVKDMKSKEMLERQTSRLKKLILSNLPKLKHIWNTDPHEIVSFESLCVVDVTHCQSLSNVFSLSLCQDLVHLQVLNIKKCCRVEEIVALEEGYVEISFNFPDLSCLKLIRLEKLRAFYEGKHSLECPSLKILNVYHCEALQVFAFNHSNLQQSHLVKELHDMPIPQALFSIEKDCQQLRYLITSSTAESLRKLRVLVVQNCENIKDVVKIDDEEAEEVINFESLESMELSSLSSLRSFFDGKSALIFPSLVTCKVGNCPQMNIFSSGTTMAPLLTIVKVEDKRKRWKNDLNTTIEMLFQEKQEVPLCNEIIPS